ncbi:MAG: hypothetical protein ACI8P9_005050 [Parasphingorhabdus sp.]|jgi:hypothetical protein
MFFQFSDTPDCVPLASASVNSFADNDEYYSFLAAVYYSKSCQPFLLRHFQYQQYVLGITMDVIRVSSKADLTSLAAC